MMKEKRKILIANTLLIILINLFTFISNNLPVLVCIALFLLCLSIYIIIIKMNCNFISFQVIFLLLSFVFHVGQYILIVLNINADIPFNLVKLATNIEIISALKFYIYCSSLIFIGMLLCYLFSNVNKCLENNFYLTNKKNYFKIAIILLIIGVIPKFYVDISKLFLFLNGNYLNTYTLKVFGFINLIGHFFEYGMIMAMIYFKNNKKYSFLLLILGVICEIPIIVSGNRGWAIIFILVYFFVYFDIIKKLTIKNLNWKKIIMFIFVAHLLLTMINFVSDFRSIKIIDLNQLWKYYYPYLFKFSVFDILGEFGGTMISVIYSMRFIPSFSNYGFGTGYLFSILTIFPNIGSFLNNIRNSMVYVYSFPQNSFESLGGSYIGELYFNFGYFSLIFSIVIGYIIGYISILMKKEARRDYSIIYIICVVIFVNFLWWIRDYFSGMIREIIWTSLFLFFLNFILNYIKKKGNK